MDNNQKTKKLLSKLLKPAYGIFLFFSQFLSERETFFSDNILIIVIGIIILLYGVYLWIMSSVFLSRAIKNHIIAMDGPFKYIRHPIYTTVYVITSGIGLMFFTWWWFTVMIAFFPLWYIEARREEREMIKIHGEEYRNYMNRTGMFIPVFTSKSR